MRKRVITALAMSVLALSLTGCQKSTPKPGSIAGYDKGEQYLSIWVHSIEDTDEGRCYREAVDAFNKKYDGTYFADIEFIPRNDSGGGYSDKINGIRHVGRPSGCADSRRTEYRSICIQWDHSASGKADGERKIRLPAVYYRSGNLQGQAVRSGSNGSPVLVCTIIRTY